jgi:NAD-dependent DNA ligase
MNSKLNELMELIQEYSDYNEQYKQFVLTDDRTSEEYDYVFEKLEQIEDEIIELVNPKVQVKPPAREPYVFFLIIINLIELFFILKLI